MKAVNLTLGYVELDPANGPGMLAPATEESDGAHERDLAEVTDREHALAEAGTIALVDAKGRNRPPKPPPDPPAGEGENPGGDD